jgi:hypothetical protein
MQDYIAEFLAGDVLLTRPAVEPSAETGGAASMPAGSPKAVNPSAPKWTYISLRAPNRPAPPPQASQAVPLVTAGSPAAAASPGAAVNAVSVGPFTLPDGATLTAWASQHAWSRLSHALPTADTLEHRVAEEGAEQLALAGAGSLSLAAFSAYQSARVVAQVGLARPAVALLDIVRVEALLLASLAARTAAHAHADVTELVLILVTWLVIHAHTLHAAGCWREACAVLCGLWRLLIAPPKGSQVQPFINAGDNWLEVTGHIGGASTDQVPVSTKALGDLSTVIASVPQVRRFSAAAEIAVSLTALLDSAGCQFAAQTVARESLTVLASSPSLEADAKPDGNVQWAPVGAVPLWLSLGALVCFQAETFMSSSLMAESGQLNGLFSSLRSLPVWSWLPAINSRGEEASAAPGDTQLGAADAVARLSTDDVAPCSVMLCHILGRKATAGRQFSVAAGWHDLAVAIVAAAYTRRTEAPSVPSNSSSAPTRPFAWVPGPYGRSSTSISPDGLVNAALHAATAAAQENQALAASLATPLLEGLIRSDVDVFLRPDTALLLATLYEVGAGTADDGGERRKHVLHSVAKIYHVPAAANTSLFRV